MTQNNNGGRIISIRWGQVCDKYGTFADLEWSWMRKNNEKCIHETCELYKFSKLPLSQGYSHSSGLPTAVWHSGISGNLWKKLTNCMSALYDCDNKMPQCSTHLFVTNNNLQSEVSSAQQLFLTADHILTMMWDTLERLKFDCPDSKRHCLPVQAHEGFESLTSPPYIARETCLGLYQI